MIAVTDRLDVNRNALRECFSGVDGIERVAGVFVARGPHLGAAAILAAAREGLWAAGFELDGVAMPLGEPGSAALLVRQVGGRVYRLSTRGLEQGQFALLPDRSALIDSSCVIHQSTRGVGEAVKAAVRRGAARAVLLFPPGLRHDGGDGMMEAFGPGDGLRQLTEAKEGALRDGLRTLPCPVLELRGGPKESLRPGSSPAHPPDGPLFGVAEPAAPYLAELLGVPERIRNAGWALANASRIGRSPGDALLQWLVPVSRALGRRLWVMAAEVGRDAEMFKDGPVGIYPIVPGPLSLRQLERRERHLVRDAAFRLGVFMGGDPS